jgi:uncharacterized protein (TIGR03000 family)
MYSVVLMMALSGGGDAVDFGHRKACHGGGACSGAVACHGAVVAHGCTGAGHCHGRVARGCHGAAGCTGSCHGGGLFSKHRAHRCHGSSYGCSGSYGCTGVVGYGGGCFGGAGCTGGVIVAPGAPGVPIAPETPKVMPKKVGSLAPATIMVSLPANATLTVDGTPTTQTAAQRTLVTPALEEGTFVYTLQAQFDGQTQTQQVQVRAGETSQAQFSFPQGVVSR